MTLEEAIKTAITYEVRIRDLYKDYVHKIQDPVGQRIFRLLGDDEQNHVAYLESRLAKWQSSGQLVVEKLDSVVPPREAIEKEMAKLGTTMSRDDRKDEKQMLSKALKVELETSQFYRQLVDAMTGDAQKMFARFLEIEDGHVLTVQAELDYLSNTGYWFDIKEFDMEDM